MTSDEFMAVFRPDNRPIKVYLADRLALGIGLNGDNVLMSDLTEIELARLTVVGDTLVENDKFDDRDES